MGSASGSVGVGSASGNVAVGSDSGTVGDGSGGRVDGSGGTTDGSGVGTPVIVGVAVGAVVAGGFVRGGCVAAGACVAGGGDAVAAGEAVAPGATADARGLGPVVPAGDGAGVSVAFGLTGPKIGRSIVRPSSASLLRLNAASAIATAIDGPSRTYSANDVRPSGARSRLGESPRFPPTEKCLREFAIN